jgi:4-hydroxy-tetrahydrodipicolinate synthase
VLGTTGEATSFSLTQRQRVMRAYHDAGLPMERLMVGTGAAALADAVALTTTAAELGFAGALVLPPFYYKGVPDDGLTAYVGALVRATAVDAGQEPDCARSTALARFLLDNGCDGLNGLGTTGEATSFSTAQRQRVMRAYRDAGLPMARLMVGTGAAARADAVALTREAAALGFAGALVLPPFYYKGVPDDGLMAYADALVTATADGPIPLYLYHFPALSGVPWHVKLIRRMLDAFGTRIAGLKDSSGDLAYAREDAAISPAFKVFPSTEATLMEAREGPFAGCISATANLNADLCARAYRRGDRAALDAAVAIRKLFDGKPLVPGVKCLIAHIHGDPDWARTMAPLDAFPAADRAAALAGYDAVRAKKVA